jgi:hypothetical protein
LLNVMISSPIHFPANDIISFFCMTITFLCCVHYIFYPFICLLTPNLIPCLVVLL